MRKTLSPTPVSPEAFKSALSDLNWSCAEFARRTGLAPNTVTRWARGDLHPPVWAGEYLRAMLALKGLCHSFAL